MTSGKKLLHTLLKNIHASRLSIQSISDTAMDPSLRSILRAQLRELDAIETETHRIACRRGLELPEPDPVFGFFTKKLTRLRLVGNRSESNITAILIRRNTNGAIHGLRCLHRIALEDIPLRILCQKFLDCETAGIQQMQRFL